jgi:hypothetical protein
MNIFRVLLIGLVSSGVVLSTFSKEAAVPTAEQLEKQLTAIREMLNPGTEEAALPIKRELTTRFTYGIAEASRNLRQQSYEEALQQISQLTDVYTGATNTAFYLALQQFKTDTATLVTVTCESLLRDAKKLEEEAPAVFAKAKTAEDMLTFKAKVDELRTRFEKFFSRNSGRSSQDMHMRFSTLCSMASSWANVLAVVESGDVSKANSSLQNLKEQHGAEKVMTSPEMRKRIAEIEKKQTDIITEFVEKMKKSCLTAETSDELSKALESFNDHCRKNQNTIYNNRVLQSRTERLEQTSRQWLRVMVAIENENYQEAIQQISSMENDNYSSGLIFTPKELAEKKAILLKKSLTSTKKDKDPVVLLVTELMAKVTAVDGFGPVKQVLMNSSRSSSGYYQGELQYLQSEINGLEAMNEALKNGQYAMIFQQYGYRSYEGNQHRWKPMMDKFRAQIKNQAIGGLCGIKDFEVDKGETAESVLQGYIDSAASKKKWDLVLKYLDGYRQVFAFAGGGMFAGGTGLSWLNDETQAVRNFIAAQNFEKAEEYERALVNYLAILNSTSKRTPIEEATAAIKKIKEKHPEAYEKASKLPPAPTPGMPTDYPRIMR